MKMKECKLEMVKRAADKILTPRKKPRGNKFANQGFGEETALSEARRCLGNNRCESCNLCQLLCPDLAIMRNEETEELEVDLDLCKRCGICILVCPKGAIQMVPEF
jgi:2-oxoacid:acceptor oxidoreductase delta subunit (pyruvate/2-ketoisovalerate family)